MDNRNFFAILRRLPAPLLMIFIWILSAQSRLPQVSGIFGMDKIQHFLLYGSLAFFVSLWFGQRHWDSRFFLTAIFILLISSAYGAIDEIHQYFVTGRSCDILDWLADTLGAASATALAGVYRRVRRKKSAGAGAGL